MNEQQMQIAWRVKGSRAWSVDPIGTYHRLRQGRRVEAAQEFASRSQALAWVERQGDHWLEEQGVDVDALATLTAIKSAPPPTPEEVAHATKIIKGALDQVLAEKSGS